MVTAQKREESLQDVPIAISAFDSAALQRSGIASLGNFSTRSVPGLNVQPYSGKANSLSINMRGVTVPDAEQATTEMGVAVYVDDVYMARAQGLGSPLVEAERIEILRGPQGTLFGRNAEGGAIRIVSKKPTGEFGGNAKVSIGNYGRQKYEAHINLPEVAGFSLKFDIIKHLRGGFTKNGPPLARLNEQRSFGEGDDEGYRGSVRWQPADNIVVDYSYSHFTGKFTPEYTNRYLRPLTATPNAVNAPILGTLVTSPRPVDNDTHVKTAWTSLFLAQGNDKVRTHTLTAALDLTPSLQLKSITAFNHVHTINVGGSLTGANSFILTQTAASPSTPASAFPGLAGQSGISATTPIYAISVISSPSEVTSKTFSQEFQLNGTTADLNYTLGLFYFREKATDLRYTKFSMVFLDPTFKNPYSVNPFIFGNTGDDNAARSRAYAAFGQATWSPNGGPLHVTAGLRYTNDRKSFVRTLSSGAVVRITPPDFKESRVDPAFTVAYDIGEHANTYVRLAQAYRSGGVNVRSPTFAPYGAELNRSVEWGLKSDLFDRRLRLNVAAYYSWIKNQQLTVQLNPQIPGVTDTLNAPGNAHIRGVEIELLAAPAPGLQLGLNYGWQKGTLSSDFIPKPGENFHLPGIPRHSLSLVADYTVPVGDFGNFIAHVDYSLTSKQWLTVRDLPLSSPAVQSKIDTANARVGFEDVAVGDVRLSLSAVVYNIFDSAYPVFTAPGPWAIMNPPRHFAIEAGFRF